MTPLLAAEVSPVFAFITQCTVQGERFETLGGDATKPGQWPWRKAILGQMVQVQGEPVAGEITLGEISRGGGGGGVGGECGNIRNSGLLLAPECGPRKEGTRCQGNNLLLGLRLLGVSMSRLSFG